MKLLNCLGTIGTKFHHTSDDPGQPALINIGTFREKIRENGQILKLSCSSSPSNYMEQIGEKLRKL